MCGIGEPADDDHSSQALDHRIQTEPSNATEPPKIAAVIEAPSAAM
jgi:hypothetical protein